MQESKNNGIRKPARLSPALLCALALSLSVDARAGIVLQRIKAAPVCPASAADVGSWRDSLVQSTLDKYVERSFTNSGDISSQIENCIASDRRLTLPGYRACLQDLREFARATADQGPGHLANFAMKDEDYNAGVGLANPQMMQLPPALDPARDPGAKKLVALLGDPSKYDQAVAEIEKLNASKPPAQRWRLARYSSQHLATPDGAATMGRVILQIPGQNYDQWVQFGVPTKDNPARPNTLSMVAVEKRDAQGNTITPVKVRAKDFWRVYDANGGLEKISTRLAETRQSDNCANCHKSGVIPFNPASGSTTAADDRVLESFNSQIEDYGPVQMDGATDLNAFGPGIGDSSIARPDAFFDKCAKSLASLPPDQRRRSYVKLRDAMSCTSCHNGTYLNKLNMPMGIPANPNLIETFVRSGLMPPGNGKKPEHVPPGESPTRERLSFEEKSALTKCLSQEYTSGVLDAKEPPGVFRKWLTGPACPSTFTGQANCPRRPAAARQEAPNSGLPDMDEVVGRFVDDRDNSAPPARTHGLCDPHWVRSGGKWTAIEAPPEGWADAPEPGTGDQAGAARTN